MEDITAVTIRDLVAAGRIVEAKALLTVGEGSLSAEELHACNLEIEQRQLRAEELVAKAEAMEAAGRTEEAKILYEAVVSLVADFPGIQEHIKRMEEALLLTRAVQHRGKRLRGAVQSEGRPGQKRWLVGAGVVIGGAALAIILLMSVSQSILRGPVKQNRPEPGPATVQPTPTPTPVPSQLTNSPGQPQVEPPVSSPTAPEALQMLAPAIVRPAPEPPAAASANADAGIHPSSTEPAVSASEAEPPLSSIGASLAAETATPASSMANGTPGKPARVDRYIVQSGDSLSLIAERLFCSASVWQQIRHLNQEKIPDPMKIQPGLVLHLDGVESRCPAER